MNKYPFQALGFAYTIIGVIFVVGGIVEGIVAGSDVALSIGVTLLIAGVLLLTVVWIETRRENEGPL